MDSATLTFSGLKNNFLATVHKTLGVAPSSFSNMKSALGAFVAERGLSEDDVIGSTLRDSFYKNVGKHIQQLAGQGRNAQYLANRRNLLGIWRRALVEVDRQSSIGLNRETPFQHALIELVARGSLKRTARAVGMSAATLRRWLSGAAPNVRSLRFVPRLEHLHGLPSGSLAGLLPHGLKLAEAKRQGADDQPLTGYRARLRDAGREPYAVKHVSERLKAEWVEFVAFKTTAGEFHRWHSGKSLQRPKGSRWRVVNHSNNVATDSRWYEFQGSSHVPTAGINWVHVSQYLGWLMVPSGRGGRGFTEPAAHTIANFLRVQEVEQYVEWRRARADGKMHAGIAAFLSLAESLCHPKTGYLTQSWEVFGQTVGIVSEEVWVKSCARAHSAYKAKRLDLKEEQEKSRDPQEPIKAVLALPNPLDAVADAIARLDADRPFTGGIKEALWARDRLLLKLTASNPLRRKNLQWLTYKADGTGHLRWVEGAWVIVISGKEFKNARGAAKRDYEMAVRKEVWPDIERYLRTYRPVLAQEDNHYVFVGSDSGNKCWKSLARRFAYLVGRYFLGCAPTGPHAMRHIVATSILKANPNDWNTAAWALHDQPATVMANYAHLRSNDAKRWLDPVMAGPFGRM